MGRLYTHILALASFCILSLNAWAIEGIHAQFKLSSDKAIERRLSLPKSAYLKKSFRTPQARISKRVWLNHFEQKRPAHRFRVSGRLPFEQYDLWIDAENGRTLRIKPAFKRVNVPVRVFSHSPHPNGLLINQLSDSFLEDLITDAPGSPLVGQYFATANCCRQIKCPGGGLVCDPAQWICADPSDTMSKTSNKTFSVDRAILGIGEFNNVPPVVYINSSLCARLPRAQIDQDSRGKPTFLAEPVDGNIATAESDAFSEVQVYHAASAYFKHLRRLLGNDNFCFRSRAMSCEAGGQAFHIFVNQLLPDLLLDSESEDNPASFKNQLLEGRGAQENPVVLTQLARITNAAFVTGTDIASNDPNLSIDEILGEFVKPYDYLIFFQGERDLAYDGDVVFHELTHALTSTLVPQLSSSALNDKGLYVDSGAMDEGYADYFAASFTGSSEIGEYVAYGIDGRPSLRNVDNTRLCPQDIVGEIHEDSNLWSGALWDIRKWVSINLGPERIIELDQLFLRALAQASEEESFSDQSKRILDLLAENPDFNSVYSVAEDAFFARGIRGCEKIYNLNEVIDETNVLSNPKTTLFLMSPENFGLRNFTPPPLQFKVTVPRGMTNFQIIYEQFLSDDSLVNSALVTKEDPALDPLRFAVSPEHPISWKYSDGRAIPMSDGIPIDTEGDDSRAQFQKSSWNFEAAAQSDPCTTRDVYLAPLTSDYDYILRRIRVEFNGPANLADCSVRGDDMPGPSSAGCACSTANPSGHSPTDSENMVILSCAVLIAAFLIKRRKRKAS